MTRLGDALAALTIKTTSPDGLVLVTAQGKRPPRIGFEFAEDYEDYQSPIELADQIAAALETAVAANLAERSRIVSQLSRLRVADGSADDSGYHGKVQNLICSGMSADGAVSTATTGLREWTVRIDESLEAMSTSDFCRAVNSAIADAYRDHSRQVYELKRSLFGEVGPARRHSTLRSNR